METAAAKKARLAAEKAAQANGTPAGDTTGTPAQTPAPTPETPKGPGKGKRQEIFAVTDAQLATIHAFDSRGIRTSGGVDSGALLLGFVNRARNYYDAWITAKTDLRATRRAWQNADALAKAESGNAGPSIADLLKAAREEQTKVLEAQGAALEAGDLAAATAAFQTAKSLIAKIAELEASKGAKGDKSVLEQAKSDARAAWGKAQKVEAAARVAFQIATFQLLDSAETMDDAQQEQYKKFLAQGIKADVPYTAEDMVAPSDHISVDETDADDDSDEKTETPSAGEQTPAGETPSAGTETPSETPSAE